MTATADALPAARRIIDGMLVALDEHCAIGCLFCFRADQDGDRTLDLATYARALSRCKELGAISVCLTGGEPTDHPRFGDFVRVAVQFGYACSVVTAARSPRQVTTLAEVAGLLSHVTVSADSDIVRERGRTPRSIASASRALAVLGHSRASLHVTGRQLSPVDLAAIARIGAEYRVPIEYSPLIDPDTSDPPTVQQQHYARDLAALSEVIGVTDTLRAAVDDLITITTATENSRCVSTRLYLSPRGRLRLCPYDRRSEIDTWSSRAELAAGIDAMLAGRPHVGANCALVCRR
jgi:hypothetical protein